MNVLSNDTRKIIDDARDTLVGQIPVPMMQCQQITLALTYKFMSDDDQRAERLGGERHYFAGDLEPYSWDKIMSLRLDDTQRSELYRAGLGALQESDSMPAVFREIFRDAVVPFGDHRTLALFVSTMDRMVYDDSEKLGDAYEYLLKTAEAQADAGQFRTPRHIIDFIVKIINPQKHEVIIDPACGTAGFLVSAYQHVKSQHELLGGSSSLSVPDLTRLADNLKGYDISPEMTKLAMANMYLHTQDKNPNIDNYDTLTSTDHWSEYADVMLANPPFMTPKGGIRPHSRFRVAAKRAEVLFVDYIASHLNEHGRAGIIVPEGIIFQSQNAYRQLRRLLLDESLVAVISLPSGVFNPYSGVKTSILILDKVLAPKTDYVAFFKVESDGYDLGAQRRPIGKDDLPAVAEEINEYLRRLRVGETVDEYQSTRGSIVARSKIAADGEYNLSGERYKTRAESTSQYPTVKLEVPGLFAIVSGGTPKSDETEYWDGGVPWITLVDLPAENFISEITTTERTITDAGLAHSAAKIIPANSVVVSSRATIGRVGINRIPLATNQGFKNIVIEDTDRAMAEYVALAVTRLVPEMQAQASGATYKEITKTKFAELEIPLPPLEVQRELVAEIERYQRVVDGARAVVDNWRPRFAVAPEWPTVTLRDVCDINPDTIVPATVYSGDTIFYADISSVNNGDGRFLGYNEIRSSQAPSRARRGIRSGDVLLSTVRPNLRAFTILKDVPERALASTGFAVLRAKHDVAEPGFVLATVCSEDAVGQMVARMGKGSYPSINQSDVSSIKVSLPTLEVQRAIVSELDEEQEAVNQAERLAYKMEQRIQDAIARVWED